MALLLCLCDIQDQLNRSSKGTIKRIKEQENVVCYSSQGYIDFLRINVDEEAISRCRQMITEFFGFNSTKLM